MRYFRKLNGEVFGYGLDQGGLIAEILAAGGASEITGAWPVVVVKLLPEAKTDKLATIEASRDIATVANVTAHARQWQADERSQKLLSSAITLAMAGAPLPPVWRDAANSDMPITLLAQLVAIAGAMAVQTQSAYSKSWTLKAQANAALTPEAVALVVW